MAKRPPPQTADTLLRHAHHYLARYAASAAGVRAVLARRVARGTAPTDPDAEPPEPAAIEAMLDDVMATLARQGVLDDAAFARGRAARLVAKGQPASRIRRELAVRHGVDVDEAEGLDESLAALDPLAQATRWAERRRLGPFRRIPRPDKRMADISSLVRAGFSPGVAVQVIDGSGREDREA